MAIYHCWIEDIFHEDDAVPVEAFNASLAAEIFAKDYRKKEGYECPDAFDVVVLAPSGDRFDFPVTISYVPTVFVHGPC